MLVLIKKFCGVFISHTLISENDKTFNIKNHVRYFWKPAVLNVLGIMSRNHPEMYSGLNNTKVWGPHYTFSPLKDSLRIFFISFAEFFRFRYSPKTLDSVYSWTIWFTYSLIFINIPLKIKKRRSSFSHIILMRIEENHVDI